MMAYPLAVVASLNIFRGIFEYGGRVIAHPTDLMLSSAVCEMSTTGLIITSFQDVIDLIFSNIALNL